MSPPFQTNKYWIIGPAALVDVSTPKYPRAIALIDLVDLPIVVDGKGRWWAHRPRVATYAMRNKCRDKMHRRIIGFSGADHINMDGLDNRRRNLRAASHSQQRMNSPPKGPYKGVSFHKASNKWQAQIGLADRNCYLGVFADPAEAARAYDAAAKQAFGEFARLNFPGDA